MSGLVIDQVPDLVIVDTFNLLYKYHYKLNLTTSTGQPSGGVYGILRNLDTIIANYGSSKMVWVFDSIPNDKREIDPEYKRNRIRNPGINPQVEALWEFFKVLRIPCLKVEGREADDIMAQLVFQATSKADANQRNGFRVCLVTEDHDMVQLLDHGVFMHKHRSGEIVTHKEMEEHFKVPCWRVPEIQAIMGCVGDNVRGVPGFGEIKAIKAIQKWGDLKTAIDNEPKLQAHRELIMRNYLLVKQSGTADIPFDVAAHAALTHYHRRAWNMDKLRELLRQWEFTTLEKQWVSNGIYPAADGV